MKRGRFIVLAVFSVIAIAAITALLAFQRGSDTQEQTLPDGTVVVFRGYDYGKVHRLVLGNLRQRMLARILPINLARKFGATVLTYTNSSPVLLVWMELHPPSGKVTLPAIGPSVLLQFFAKPGEAKPFILTDADGTEFTQNSSTLATRTTNGIVAGIPFPILPRTSTNLEFRFVTSAFPKPMPYQAKFTFPNPVFTPQRAWRTRPYPITATCSNLTNLTFTLVALTALSNIEPGFTAMRVAEIGFPDAWMKAQYRIGDTEGRGWSIQSVRIDDANGAAYVPLFRDYGSAGPTADGPVSSVDFACGLNTREPWRLHFQLRCSKGVSNDLYTARSIPLPGATNESFVPIRAQLQGHTIVIRGFSNLGPKDALSVAAVLEPPDDSYELTLVSAETKYGSRITTSGTYTATDGSRVATLWLFTGVKQVDLTYSLTRKAFVDVIAQPTIKP